MDMDTIILIIVAASLVTALILFRSWQKKASAIDRQGYGPDNALERIEQLRRQLPTDTDQQACDRIEARVKAVSRTFSMQTSIAPKKVYDLAAELTREIAAIYHPGAEDPILQASISDLIQLNERIVTRLNIKLREFPLNTAKDISIHSILKSKNIYDKKIKNKIEWFQKFQGLYKAGSRAWMSYNVLNPWYWGRKVAYTSVKEITFRYLLTWIVTIVGEEAMTVYSQRDITTNDALYERDLAFAMVDVARASEPISADAYTLVLDHIFNKSRLSDTVRIDIARALTVKKSEPNFRPQGPYTQAQADRLLKEINKVAAVQGPTGPETSQIIQKIDSALSRLIKNGQIF
jgi:hypothetical protein